MGVRPVRLLVDGPVSTVAVELDGRFVGRIDREPWTLPVDFGREYAPHELVARALDRQGQEVARARQWINLPRPPAEVEILLERDDAGRAVAARLAWASLLGPNPTRIMLTFDGRALPIDGERRAKFPIYDPSLTHIITALLEFPNDVRSRTDLVIGGGSSGEAGSDLTAVPARFASEKPPPVESLQGSFQKNGAPVRVTALEHGPADLVLVRDLNTDQEEAAALLRGLTAIRIPSDGTSLDREDRLHILWPVVREVPDLDHSNALFESSRVFSGAHASMGFLLLRVGYPGENRSPRLFADAVAVAGLRASAGCSRRAVVLVLGGAGADASRSNPPEVRRYLERLHVPLYVWSLAGTREDAPAAAWGAFEEISSVAALRRAVERLRKDLQSQSIVWIEGRHLPQQITLSDEAAGIEIVR